MKIIRTLGFVTAIASLASWLDARSTRQRDSLRERERLDRTRWEGEGGATPSGAHVSETPPPQGPYATSTPGTETPRGTRSPASPPFG